MHFKICSALKFLRLILKVYRYLEISTNTIIEIVKLKTIIQSFSPKKTEFKSLFINGIVTADTCRDIAKSITPSKIGFLKGETLSKYLSSKFGTLTLK